MTEKRRDFIKKGLIGTGGLAIGGMGFSAKSYGSIIGANERIALAVIGIHGQGKTHIGNWCSLKTNRNVFLKTICDVDEELYAEKVENINKLTGTKPLPSWE